MVAVSLQAAGFANTGREILLLLFVDSLFSRQMRDYLSGFQEQCDAILDDVNSALQHLESLQKQYLFVSTKTGTLHEACEQLLKEQVIFDGRITGVC